jgi:hypothetical protein
MLQLFVAPTPFEGWGERAYDGTPQRQLLAVLIVSVGALALTLCVALLMLFADEPLGPPDQSRFPITGLFNLVRGVARHPPRPCTHKLRLVSSG